MTAFQIFAISILVVLTVWELRGLWRRPSALGLPMIRIAVWISAVVAIANPGLVQRVADTLGIGRGANLVSYLFSLAFLATSFYFYSRYVRLERQITELVRHIALAQARREHDGTRDADG